MSIYFEGCCPESLIKGNRVAMRLNEDDFWESEATGLQVVVMPPYATILRWRGCGHFRQTPGVAPEGLLLAKASKAAGQEIFPDEGDPIQDAFDLEWYLGEIYKSKEAFESAKFDPTDPVFRVQEAHLHAIVKVEWQELLSLYDRIFKDGLRPGFMSSDLFEEFHRKVYAMQLVFDFKWSTWEAGWQKLRNPDADFSGCSLLEVSMFLTAIFRADRFDEGALERAFMRGTMEKLVGCLRRWYV